MFRVLQSLEREPSTLANSKHAGSLDHIPNGMEGVPHTDGESQNADGKNASIRRANPHKYLLYRPSFSQLALYIATAFKDLHENGVLFLYVSADGVKNHATTPGYNGGLGTAVAAGRKPSIEASQDTSSALAHCLHPMDLVPFTRKPMFVVVDSTNSTAFQVS
jgi:hypothetical protein